MVLRLTAAPQHRRSSSHRIVTSDVALSADCIFDEQKAGFIEAEISISSRNRDSHFWRARAPSGDGGRHACVGVRGLTLPRVLVLFACCRPLFLSRAQQHAPTLLLHQLRASRREPPSALSLSVLRRLGLGLGLGGRLTQAPSLRPRGGQQITRLSEEATRTQMLPHAPRRHAHPQRPWILACRRRAGMQTTFQPRRCCNNNALCSTHTRIITHCSTHTHPAVASLESHALPSVAAKTCVITLRFHLLLSSSSVPIVLSPPLP